MPDLDYKSWLKAHPNIRHYWLYEKPTPSPLYISMDQTGHYLPWASGTPYIFDHQLDKQVRTLEDSGRHLLESQYGHLVWMASLFPGLRRTSLGKIDVLSHISVHFHDWNKYRKIQ